MVYIIEGIDRLGKSTLIDGLLNELGYHLYIHYEKPIHLDKYNSYKGDALEKYQYETYLSMFQLIESNVNIIFDRGHLGEVIYSPLYRNYSGDYVYTLEKSHNTKNCRLVLLTTSNFNIQEDDGLSHNWDNREKEQNMFINAFTKSNIKDKVLIDVHNGNGNFKSKKEILNLALKRI